jgi:tetrachloro-p-hydroquinone reductive dehalogenase
MRSTVEAAFMDKVKLYHYPLSFRSQVARLVLTECGIPWEGQVVDIGPLHENFRPWYMRINPKGTVPTLEHNGRHIVETIDIIRYVNENLHGKNLVPEDPEAAVVMDRWVRIQDGFPERELTYGTASGLAAHLSRRGLAGRRRRMLRVLRERVPELRELYDAKLADVDRWQRTIDDTEEMDRIRGRLEQMLDELEEHIQGREWIAGEDYSLADAVWTVLLARLELLKLSGLWAHGKRPAIAAFYERVKQRPSFAAADIHTRLKPSLVLPGMLRAFWPRILAALVLFAILALWARTLV